MGSFGRVEIAVPRARLESAAGKTTEWKSSALRACQRRTKQADSLIAGAYLAGTNTRRVRRALSAVFGALIIMVLVRRTASAATSAPKNPGRAELPLDDVAEVPQDARNQYATAAPRFRGAAAPTFSKPTG
jgi:hypothetical protein